MWALVEKPAKAGSIPVWCNLKKSDDIVFFFLSIHFTLLELSKMPPSKKCNVYFEKAKEKIVRNMP